MTTPGSILGDCINWVRRIVKAPSAESLPDQTIIDYINRFYVYDLSERLQLFELRRQYTFETIPNIFEYQFPYLNYQLIEPPVYCDGVQMGFYISNDQFYKIFPELVLNEQPIYSDGTSGPYSVNFGRAPILRGFTDDLGNLLPYVYITAINSSGDQLYIVDDGLGNLNQTDATFQNIIVKNCGVVDYVLGTATFSFNTAIPSGEPITTQCTPFSGGFPRLMLFFNNTIKLYPVPKRAHKIQCDAYITPSQFLNSASSVTFNYMAEYIARGAAQKILSDTGDVEQYNFYEPLFRTQEAMVLRRSSRIKNQQRTPTIFQQISQNNPYQYAQY